MIDAAFLLVLVPVSALVVRLMTERGVLDVPGARSSHDRPTPKGGGIGIATALGLGLLAAIATGRARGADLEPALGLLGAAGLIGAVAWADDLHQFGFGWKLAAQILSAAILVASGWVLHRIGPVDLGRLSLPLTLAFLVFVTNGLNFIDGLNGLASGSCLIVALSVGTAAWRAGDPLLVASSLSLAAGIAGFLPFNYPTARIFMGDVGSQICGLTLAAAATRSERLLPADWGAALAILGLFAILADVAFTLLRRALAGDRLTEAHRGHLYQLARRAGIPAARVTLIYWALTAIGCAVPVLGARGGCADMGAAAIAIGLAWSIWMLSAVSLARKAALGKW